MVVPARECVGHDIVDTPDVAKIVFLKAKIVFLKVLRPAN